MGGKDMKGKVCLVTGGSSGVGLAIASGCARLGATVAIASRDRTRGEAAAKALRDETGNREVEWLGADLANLDSVRSLAEGFGRRYGGLHVLSNNAAVLSMKRRTSAQGFELTFATNYLAHFLLTALLLPMLKAAAPARVITVSGHPASIVGARLDFGDLMLERGYSPIRATLGAALARVLFSLELARRLEGRGVSSNTFHPGLVRSGLPASLPWALRLPARVGMVFLSRECATGVRLACSEEVEGITGRFFVGAKSARFEPSYDLAAEALRLWRASEALVGQGVAGG
ncbi:MAG TPA: SDR family NAD(P)-dependent oxidoreductase [Rectinemataceae bacterium]|nr:SDR family NAD(P)-dependent oxidoreductase [Rectinemataceae bacterium]